jgi:superfamily I DNA/RNA helicase
VQQYGLERLREMASAEPVVFVSTPHRVKGGEADYVAVILDCTRKVQANITRNIDEELRVLYVSCTRTRRGLYLVHSRSYSGLDRILDMVAQRTGEGNR